MNKSQHHQLKFKFISAVCNLTLTMSTTATVHRSNTALYCKFTTLLQANLFILNLTAKYFHTNPG